MSEISVEKQYNKTLDLSEGLKRELEETTDHNRFKVLQKHIRYHVLDILVQKYADNGIDLKWFILHHHHDGEQLSQRDIAKRLKDKLKRLDSSEKIQIIKEAANEIARVLTGISVKQYRQKITLTLKDKQKLLDRAMGDDFEEKFLKRLKSFDQKTIANFIATFNLPVRRKNEKNNGAACKKKLSRHRRHNNHKMWTDPEARESMCQAMKDSWGKRKKRAKKEL